MVPSNIMVPSTGQSLVSPLLGLISPEHSCRSVMKIRNVRLVNPDDREFKAHKGHYAQASRHLRPTLDASPLQKLSHQVEDILREWLTHKIDLSERRILRYERLKRSGQYRTYFKEIDAVQGRAAADGPRRLLEFKCSSNVGTLGSAGKQLNRSLQPLRCRWDHEIYRHAILVAVIPARMNLSGEPTPLSEFRPSIPEEADPKDRMTTLLSAQDLWDWGTSQCLIGAESDLFDKAQSTARTTLEKRRRRAELKNQGVPKEEWPDDLQTGPPDVPDSEVVSYGTESDDSRMGQALRDAFGLEDD